MTAEEMNRQRSRRGFKEIGGPYAQTAIGCARDDFVTAAGLQAKRLGKILQFNVVVAFHADVNGNGEVGIVTAEHIGVLKSAAE